MKTRTWARFLAAAAAGALLGAARPPLDVGPLALVALVPLFVAWHGQGARRRAALAFVAGAVYYGWVVSWAWFFGAIAIVPLVGALAAYWAVAGAGLGWFARHGIRSPWLTAAVWVLAEAAVARFPLDGLSWGEVGYALHDVGLARDVASVGGVPLVSFLVVAVNALLADAAVRVAWPVPARGRGLARAAGGLAVVALAVGAALVVRTDTRPAGELRVAILQGNDKNRELTTEEIRQRFLPNSHFGLAQQVGADAQLVIFPESSMDEDPRTDPALGDRLEAIARDRDAWVLANATADAPEDPDRHVLNLNVLYGPSGSVEGTYTKRHLVPFGEQVPLGSILRPLVPVLDEEIPRDYLSGHEPGIFPVAGTRIATIICFESAFSHEVRPLVRDGAEVIVVSTNNRSYRRSANSAQHVALGQMRAAETGRPLVHAGISGISALIDADGRVVADTELFDRTVLEGAVTPHTGQTLYVRFGDWLVWGSLIAGTVAAAAALLRRRDGFVDSEPAARTHPTGAGEELELTSTGDRA